MEKNRTILSRPHGLMIFKSLSILAIALLGWPALLCGAGAGPLADRLTLDQILSNVKESELKLKTFTASYKQVQKSHLLVKPILSEGRMSYHYTGKLLMEVSDPEPYVILIKDRLIIMGDPVKKTYKKKSLPGRNALLKRYLGGGQPLAALKQKFAFRLIDDCSGTACQLELVPKKQNRNMPYAFIRVVIDTKRWLPKAIRLEEPNDDYTEFELSYLTINDPLPEDLFTIELSPEELDDPFEPKK
jgi:outer membrane lipoprotein-sorting protein